ncbi:MAG: hypothetical protein MUP74_00275, partial [Desulfobacterales bacterium]|nr:hypothetical protein [Desulfobacterales bacterium]
MGNWEFPRYETVAQKMARAARKRKQLEKKTPHIQPVLLEGRALATTWWGKAWNENLECYADFANRIGRGRSYVRHGAVLDLRVDPGEVAALVQGTRARPYAVKITIAALGPKTWTQIKTACAGQLESLQNLMAGQFPKALADIFSARGKGLFPAPGEIKLDCSCPDWATMCKHVAATLYGIGARLDQDPSLFFKLRRVQMEDLVAETLDEAASELLKKAGRKSGRIIADSDLGDVFGIVMEDTVDFGKAAPPPPPERSGVMVRNPAGRHRSRAIDGQRNRRPVDDRAQVLDLITRSPDGITVPALRERTGLDTVKIRNIVYSAYQKGTVAKVGRGIYKGRMRKKSPADESKTVVALISQAPRGIGIAALKEKTGLTDTRLRNIVARAHAQGVIERIARGIYAGKQHHPPRQRFTELALQIIRKSETGVGFGALRQQTGLDGQRLRNIIFRL